MRLNIRGAKDLKLDLFETAGKRPKTTGMPRAGVQNVVGLLCGGGGGHLGDWRRERCCAPRPTRAQQANGSENEAKMRVLLHFYHICMPAAP